MNVHALEFKINIMKEIFVLSIVVTMMNGATACGVMSTQHCALMQGGIHLSHYQGLEQVGKLAILDHVCIV